MAANWGAREGSEWADKGGGRAGVGGSFREQLGTQILISLIQPAAANLML